jgi:16S rRNA processing protein RimM
LLAKEAWVPLAEILRPHGVRGEVRLKVFNADSDLLLDADEVLLRTKDGEEHEVSVDRARRADDAILMKLYSVDDRDRAGELRGALVCMRRGSFPEPEDGEFYACDIVGAEVWVKRDPEPEKLGAVKELRHYPTTAVLVVAADDGGKDWEVPLYDTFVEKIDVEGSKVWLSTLEGIERG